MKLCMNQLIECAHLPLIVYLLDVSVVETPDQQAVGADWVTTSKPRKVLLNKYACDHHNHKDLSLIFCLYTLSLSLLVI